MLCILFSQSIPRNALFWELLEVFCTLGALQKLSCGHYRGSNACTRNRLWSSQLK